MSRKKNLYLIYKSNIKRIANTLGYDHIMIYTDKIRISNQFSFIDFNKILINNNFISFIYKDKITDITSFSRNADFLYCLATTSQILYYIDNKRRRYIGF